MTATMAAAGPTAVAARGYFYFYMALAVLAVAVAGFTPTYVLPLLGGASLPFLLHLHAFFLFGWTLIFCWQSFLASQGRIATHRRWGMLGIAIAVMMPATVMALVAIRTFQAQETGDAAIMRTAHEFSWVQVVGALFFIAAFALAIINAKRTETHKRLMLLASISLLGAPIARFFILMLAPAGAAAPGTVAAIPPVELAILPSLIGDLLLIPAVIFDLKTRKSVHPVYVIGGASLLALQGTMALVAKSGWWLGLSPLLGRLG